MAEHNPFPGENNTGHVWDDNLRELANPPTLVDDCLLGIHLLGHCLRYPLSHVAYIEQLYKRSHGLDPNEGIPRGRSRG